MSAIFCVSRFIEHDAKCPQAGVVTVQVHLIHALEEAICHETETKLCVARDLRSESLQPLREPPSRSRCEMPSVGHTRASYAAQVCTIGAKR